jgi:capsule synthesis protein PGA_cap
VLDYGFPGLEETLDTLTAVGLKIAGAGRDITEARRPAFQPLRSTRSSNASTGFGVPATSWSRRSTGAATGMTGPGPACEAAWLRDMVNRISCDFGATMDLGPVG